MTMSRVDNNNVNARFYERAEANLVIDGYTNGRADTEAPSSIFAGAWKFNRLCNVFRGNDSAQLECLVHHNDALKPVLVHERASNRQGLALLNRDETFKRRHDFTHELMGRRREAQVSPRHYTNEQAARLYYRKTRDTIVSNQFSHRFQTCLRANTYWFTDHSGFKALYPRNFARLRFNRKIFANDADTTELRDGDCEWRFGHGVHCC